MSRQKKELLNKGSNTEMNPAVSKIENPKFQWDLGLNPEVHHDEIIAWAQMHCNPVKSQQTVNNNNPLKHVDLRNQVSIVESRQIPPYDAVNGGSHSTLLAWGAVRTIPTPPPPPPLTPFGLEPQKRSWPLSISCHLQNADTGEREGGIVLFICESVQHWGKLRWNGIKALLT